jgi:hypothetical protein
LSRCDKWHPRRYGRKGWAKSTLNHFCFRGNRRSPARFWTAPAEQSGDGAFRRAGVIRVAHPLSASESGVAIRLPPQIEAAQPECARPRALQRGRHCRRWKTPVRHVRFSPQRPGTGALRSGSGAQTAGSGQEPGLIKSAASRIRMRAKAQSYHMPTPATPRSRPRLNSASTRARPCPRWARASAV